MLRFANYKRTSIWKSNIRYLSQDKMRASTNQVTLNKNATHDLFYVEGVSKIETGPIIGPKTVPAYELSNNKGITVKAMREGGNMVQLNKNGKEYIWDNRDGACFYGGYEPQKQTNFAFPLQKGLILHGGVRFAVITAELVYIIIQNGKCQMKYQKMVNQLY